MTLTNNLSQTMRFRLHPFPPRIYHRGVFFVFVLLFYATKGVSQDNVTTQMDSVILIRDTVNIVEKHSVRKATLLSTFLPGAGQVYNKKIWKVPIVYAAFAGMAYLIKFNHDNFRKFDDALLMRYDEDPNTIDPYVNVYTEENLRSLSDFYRRNRDLSVIGLTLVYVLNIIDAHVDAHLFNFNVDDNLSLQWSPLIQPVPGQASTGIALTLHF